MKNLPVVIFILILVLFDKILVLFDRSIRIPRAHARIYKFFYPCNRCHLATLLENQRVTCGNEVTRVTTNGDFEGAASVGRSPGVQGSKVPPPWVEGTGFMTLGDYL